MSGQAVTVGSHTGRVTAVIPHWNRKDLLEILLPNLREQTRPFDEILVVDNGSSDGSAEWAEAHGARVIRLPDNRGFATAVNRGVQAAGNADWIAILNNDVTLEPAWLDSLLNAFSESEAPIWFATGKILSARDHSLLDGTWDEIARSGCALRCGEGKPDSPFWNQPRRIRMTSMTAALFRADLFKQVGLLDETFESYLEDVDFGLRCLKAECYGMYQPVAISHHQGSSTWGRWNPDSVKRIARNQILLVTKHFQGMSRFPIVAGQLLWGLLAFRHGCGRAFLAGRRQARLMSAAVGAVASSSFQQIIKESEQEILAIQRETGFDRYWRAYFWLLRR